MRLFNNTYDDSREIQGFKKDEILEVKIKISELKNQTKDMEALDDFLHNLFKKGLVDSHSKYLDQIEAFIEDFLIHSRKELYSELKSIIIEELALISSNLVNIMANTRNVKRLLKNNDYLDEYTLISKNALERSNTLATLLKRNSGKFEIKFDDEIYLWIESNKIKNLQYKLNYLHNLTMWEEVNGLSYFIQSLRGMNGKKTKKQKNILINFHFEEILQYFVENYPNSIHVYTELIYLLFQNNFFEEESSEDFINVMERKEVVQKLKDQLRPVMISLISSKLEPILNEIKENVETYGLEGKQSINLKKLFNQKFSEFLPQIIDYYFTLLDKKLHKMMDDVDETSTEDFVMLIKTYREKINIIAKSIDDIDTWILRFDRYLKPYENITDSLKKTLASLNHDLNRRKEEYQNYLNSVRDEGLRLEIRRFVDKKIVALNELIGNYEDKASVIIREELPQLKEIRELLRDYKLKIKSIKSEVFDKLDEFKERDIDTYQVIKHWEENFNRKKQQLTFLLTILLNKIFKSFKDLIDEESILFAEITEITKQAENFEGLPINFALSAFLADKLTEEELRERISEMNAKINTLTSSLGLYQVEKAKLEEILTNKIKEKQGIATSDVQCTVCHENINFAKDKLITCPFCGSTYHYLCVAAWLSKYNSCPMCQNHFLEPFSNMFETE